MSEPRHAMTSPFPARLDRVRNRLRNLGLDALAVSVGPDLPWLCGYEAMPLERLTMLVVPVDGPATLVVPALEAPRVNDRGDVTVRPWGEADDPIAIVDALVPQRRVAIGDRTWARFLIEWQSRHGELRFERAQTVTGVLRERKEPSEIAVLQRAAAAVDGIAADLQSGTIPLVGRTEADVSADLSQRLLAAGHHRVNFAIVAAGRMRAHIMSRGCGVSRPRKQRLRRTMLDDFGVGYCSDTEMRVIGEPSSEYAGIYGVLNASRRRAWLRARSATRQDRRCVSTHHPRCCLGESSTGPVTGSGSRQGPVHRGGKPSAIEVVTHGRSNQTICPGDSACVRISWSRPRRACCRSIGPITPWPSADRR
jgi:Xaa-Pro aminopeptidase